VCYLHDIKINALLYKFDINAVEMIAHSGVALQYLRIGYFGYASLKTTIGNKFLVFVDNMVEIRLFTKSGTVIMKITVKNL
jgi:hypothetical protein